MAMNTLESAANLFTEYILHISDPYISPSFAMRSYCLSVSIQAPIYDHVIILSELEADMLQTKPATH